jgi:hypothetical protein
MACPFARACMLALLALTAWVPAGGFAQEAVDEALERRVKAAFLYRFLDYVTWPEQVFARPDSPIVIGVMASDAIAAELTQVAAGRSIGGRPVAVRALREADAPVGLHALFIGQAANARVAQISRTVPGAVLIVTEAENGLAQGGIINFLIADGKVRFEVGLRGAEKRALRLSARLLSVALNVRKDSMRPALSDVIAQVDRSFARFSDRFMEFRLPTLR